VLTIYRMQLLLDNEAALTRNNLMKTLLQNATVWLNQCAATWVVAHPIFARLFRALLGSTIHATAPFCFYIAWYTHSVWWTYTILTKWIILWCAWQRIYTKCVFSPTFRLRRIDKNIKIIKYFHEAFMGRCGFIMSPHVWGYYSSWKIHLI